MIRAEITASGGGEGRWQLTISGHGDPAVCAAVTALEQSTAIWLEQLAELRPADLTLTITDQSQEDP